MSAYALKLLSSKKYTKQETQEKKSINTVICGLHIYIYQSVFHMFRS